MSTDSHEITVTVNGTSYRRTVESRLLLSDFLRHDLLLAGTHVGCEHGVCGACTVIFDGAAVRSCLMFAAQADGHAIMTVEGLALDREHLHPLQESMRDCHGLQCGYCTPGILMTMKVFLDETPSPDKAQIREALSGNLCRCTGYQHIVDAMQLAAEVERLAAELQASHTRITELEARIDVDPLTETLNRRGFERELTRSLAYVKRYAVSAALVYLDLDDFKPVNDRHGHAAGDAVLKAIAATLVRHVRASDVVARIGGDEFVVLLWNVTDADAAAKASALEAAVYATPVRWGASTLVVGASAGLSIIGPLDTSAEVLARADAAMYARKMERRQALDGRFTR
jgi:carbon-monoxide dehydrogenase small subunit